MFVTTLDTKLYDISIPLISRLQQTLSGQEALMQTVSTAFDPKYAFLIYSPVAYLLDPKVGKTLIMTTVSAEWINQILKWLLHGERPYWYVHSSGHFDASQVPIKQFPITCELGPGHPSGHAMLTAAVWYIILKALLDTYKQRQDQEQQEHNRADLSSGSISSEDSQYLITKLKSLTSARLSAWTLYVGMIATVSVSRVFLGCHFPHQCLVGALLGAGLASWMSRQDIKPVHFVASSAVLFTSAFGTFGLLRAFGFDPNWTFALATKYCVNPDYIHLDTAPFFSIMRYCGFALGCGLGLMYPIQSWSAKATKARDLRGGELTETADQADQTITSTGQQDQGEILLVAELPGGATGRLLKQSLLKYSTSSNLIRLSCKLATVSIAARLVDNLPSVVPHSKIVPFYSCAFLAYTAFSYSFINL